MTVLIVGAGGLGGPIALALGAAEIPLVIVDDDRVDVSNLHRQVQFTDEDLGADKATLLARRVGTHARGMVGRWPIEVTGIAIVVDASDDAATKFSVSDTCVAHGIPYVVASALRYGGNVMVGAPGSGCYRCLFEDVPLDAPSCASAGVLGPIVGAIGAVAAALVLRLVNGDRSDAGSIYVFDDLRFDRPPRVVRFDRRAGCPACTRS